MNGSYKYWEVVQENNCYRNDIMKLVNRKDLKVCNQTLNTRIGSESAAGLVYKIKLEEIDVALKIMPIISDSCEKSNKKETHYMRQTSNLVKDEQSPYFLYLITAGKCYDFKYPEQKDIKEKFAREYFGEGKLQVDYYVAELAKMDLGQWLDHYYNPNDMYIYLQQIIRGILALHGEIILHADLHLGNIVIVERGKKCESICCITDFGLSMDIFNDDDYFSDYLFFLNQLFSKLRNKNDKVSKLLHTMRSEALGIFNSMEEKDKYLEYILEKYF